MSEKKYTKEQVDAALSLVVAVTTREVSEKEKVECLKQLPESLQESVTHALVDGLFNLMAKHHKIKCEAAKAFAQALKDKIAEQEKEEDEEEYPKPTCSCKGKVKIQTFDGFDEFMKYWLSQR